MEMQCRLESEQFGHWGLELGGQDGLLGALRQLEAYEISFTLLRFDCNCSTAAMRI